MKLLMFCDESRHIEKGKDRFMVIGGTYCLSNSKDKILGSIKALKREFDVYGELKWRNVSPSKLDFYKNIVRYFFNEPNLSFRCIVVDKAQLDHSAYDKSNQDSFFYKMYYFLLKKVIEQSCEERRDISDYYFYLDYKDTLGSTKTRILESIIYNKFRNIYPNISIKFQILHSKDSLLIQLTDLLIGAVGYQYNSHKGSEAKNQACKEISNYLRSPDLVFKSPYSERKFDIFRIDLQEKADEVG